METGIVVFLPLALFAVFLAGRSFQVQQDRAGGIERWLEEIFNRHLDKEITNMAIKHAEPFFAEKIEELKTKMEPRIKQVITEEFKDITEPALKRIELIWLHEIDNIVRIAIAESHKKNSR